MAGPLLALPALGATAKLVGWGSLMAGAGTAGYGLLTPEGQKQFKLTPKDRVKGMDFDRTAPAGERLDYGFGDWVLSELTGQDLGQLEKAAQTRSDNALINEFGKDTDTLKSRLRNAGLLNDQTLALLKPQAGQSQARYESAIERVRSGLDAVDYGNALDLDMSSILKSGNLPSMAVVQGLKSQADKAEKARLEGKADDRTRIADQRYDDAVTRQTDQQNLTNQLAISDREYRKWKTAEDDKWRRYQLDRDRADRAIARRDRKDELLMTMQQRTLDRNFERERADRADARADRDKRTAMLMQMVQGLSKLGYGMAI